MASKTPWAFAIALLLVAGLEVFLQLAVPADEFPVRREIRQSAAFHRVLAADGAPEIAFVGASLMRRGVVVPEISAALQAATGREWTVANYGHHDAQAEFVEDMVLALMADDTPSQVVLYGVSPLQLNRSGFREHTSQLWGMSDLRREWGQRGTEVLGDVPQVLHNELKHHFRLPQLRHERVAWFKRIAFGIPFQKTPLRGGIYHVSPGSKANLVDHPPTLDTPGFLALKRRIDRATDDGRWLMSDQLIAHMKGVAAACEANGAKLVYFEIPFHRTLEHLLAPNAYPDFYAQMEAISEETGAPFVPFSELGLTFTDAHFSDEAHLNLDGASMMTAPVMEHVIARAWPATESITTE